MCSAQSDFNESVCFFFFFACSLSSLAGCKHESNLFIKRICCLTSAEQSQCKQKQWRILHNWLVCTNWYKCNQTIIMFVYVSAFLCGANVTEMRRFICLAFSSVFGGLHEKCAKKWGLQNCCSRRWWQVAKTVRAKKNQQKNIPTICHIIVYSFQL